VGLAGEKSTKFSELLKLDECCVAGPILI